MLENSYNTNWFSLSDQAILRELGLFVKETRLKLNYTQNDLAEKAGVHRVTISEFEHGLRSISLITFIELLRALDLLDAFQTRAVVSPLQMVRLEAQKRQRASHPRARTKGKRLGHIKRKKK